MLLKKILLSSIIGASFLTMIIVGVLWNGLGEIRVASAATADQVTVTGYAWSSNIGWIKFDTGKTNPVMYDTVSGQLSGYAWSSNVGWISFGETSKPLSVRSGVGGTAAKVDSPLSTTNSAVSGWARACAGTVSGTCATMEPRTDGWDGWIKFDTGKNLPVKIDLSNASTRGEFTGYAWGSDVVGWISFNRSNTSTYGTSDYKVKATLPGTTTVSNDACGDAAGGTYSSKPTSNLCDSGTVPSISENNDIWSWQCPSSGGGQGGSCTASRATITLTPEGNGGGTISARLYSTVSDLIVTKISGQGGVTSNKTINCYYGSEEELKSACKFEVSTAGTVTVKNITAAEEIDTSSFSQWGTGSVACDGPGCSVCNSLTQNGGCPDFTLTGRGDVDIKATFSSGGGGWPPPTEPPTTCTSDCDDIIYHTLTIVIDGTGTGSVKDSSEGVLCSSGTCSKSYSSGTSFSLTAEGSGSSFTGWSTTGSASCTSASDCSFNLNSDTTVTATFLCSGSSCNPDPTVVVPGPTGCPGCTTNSTTCPDGTIDTGDGCGSSGGGSVNGVCSSSAYECDTGSVTDIENITDSSINYIWKCLGYYSGDTVPCSAPIDDGSSNSSESDPLDTITLTVDGDGSLSATIIDGLQADSNEITIYNTGSCTSSITLSVDSSTPVPSGSSPNFNPDNVIDNSGDKVGFKIKSIPGSSGSSYPIKIIASASNCESGEINVTLTVEKITTTWEEF